jgi:hypothetical protein
MTFDEGDDADHPGQSIIDSPPMLARFIMLIITLTTDSVRTARQHDDGHHPAERVIAPCGRAMLKERRCQQRDVIRHDRRA